MPTKVESRPEEVREVDRWEGGAGWIAHPEERMQRASHALAADGEVWVVDPVDADPVDDLLSEFGDVAGVVVLLDRHKRDAAVVADRHDVPVYLPEWMEGVARDLAAPVERFGATLADTGYRAIGVVRNRFWQEVALYDDESGTLVVPEAVGTSAYFRAGDERLGVHPMLRLTPPRAALAGLSPDRVLVGHGEGVHEDAAGALADALSGSRRRFPRLVGGMVRGLAPV